MSIEGYSKKKSQLPRLNKEWYAGDSWVFWTHTIDDRKTGWLNPDLHMEFRELMLHTCLRYELVCPVYLLMSDHMHWIWIGTGDRSDQLKATRFIRKHLNQRLDPIKLQKQAHDHVLRDQEREHGAFLKTCEYIRQNAVRGELVKSSSEWKYQGAFVPGYPDLSYGENPFYEKFWKSYYAYRENLSG